jgi:dTMP kinase
VSSSRRGLFITLEGGDGSGKSTQAAALAQQLRDSGRAVCLTQEPAGTALGVLIKGIFERQAASGEALAGSALAETLLFEAARAEHVHSVIRPALAAGEIVVCDRFTDSTLAYQGYARGLPLEEIRACNSIATGGLVPDLTLVFDVPPRTGLARADASTGKRRDSIGQEALGFHDRVREGFLRIARACPERVVVIDATPDRDQVTRACWAAVRQRLPVD